MLPSFKYTTEQISIICQLIESTAFPLAASSKLEKILIDADLSILGRADFEKYFQNLYMEMSERNKIKATEDWLAQQTKFLQLHHYYTKTAEMLREVSKEEQISKLKNFQPTV